MDRLLDDCRKREDGLHFWHLWERERKATETPQGEQIWHWREVWYCSYCRTIEEREVHGSI